MKEGDYEAFQNGGTGFVTRISFKSSTTGGNNVTGSLFFCKTDVISLVFPMPQSSSTILQAPVFLSPSIS